MGVAADIASLRTRYPAIAAAVFSDRCSVSRVTQADDGRGQWTDIWAAVSGLTGIPCAFVPYSSVKEIVIAGKPVAYADGDVWLPAQHNSAALSVNEKDRLVIAANGLESQRTVEIIFPEPHQGILIQAIVRLVGA